MVSIDLDNIIHYHPHPIPKPPCKPPHLTAYHYGSSYHPLPPRPPCLSHESPHTCHPRPQSPSPAASSLPLDRDVHLNEFDKELANLEMAEFRSQETPGSCFGGSEATQAENINDPQRKELHDQDGEVSHHDDRSLVDLRLPSENPTTPQDTVASSNAVEPDRSSAADAPTSPVGADGSVSPNKPCPIQDPSPTKLNETQLSIFGCEKEVVNSVAAGESCYGLTTQNDCNVSRDKTPSPKPSTLGPARDEPETANQRLETGTECGKSSPRPVTEAHSIQLHARDNLATHDSNDIHSTDHCPSDKPLSSPISPILQQQKQAVSRSEETDSPRDLSTSYSVSVVVPVTRSYGLPITRSTGAGSTRCKGKRKTRAKSPCNVDSDDPDDYDYTDGNDSGVDIAALPRLTKRPRRTAPTKIRPSQAQRESPHRMFSSPAPDEETANPCHGTSLQDIQTIPIRGFLTRQTFLSRVIYSCTFEEDRQPSCQHRPTKAPAYEESLDKTGHTTQPSNKKPSAYRTRFLPAEDELLIELKEKRSLPWNRIVRYFPGRTKGVLQVRYSTKLKDRGAGSLRRGRSGRVTYPAAAAVA